MERQQAAQQPIGADGPRVARIGLGCMGLSGTANPAEVGPEHVRRAVASFEAALDAGITLYDHADVYSGGSCEAVFKECLHAVPGARERIVVATKCGLGNNQHDLSARHIRVALEESLARLGVDYVDLYQMHRPDPLTHPAETAGALNDLLRRGLIRYVGVSNYYPEQVRALQQYLDAPICGNQIEISLLHLEPIYEGLDSGNGRPGDGTLDQCMAMRMTPLAYAPVGRGLLTGARPLPEENHRASRLREELDALAASYGGTPTQIALAWLLAHPANIIPLVGSNSPEHIREAMGALKITLSREDWYRLWVTAWGRRLP